jgi:hypothetical protein
VLQLQAEQAHWHIWKKITGISIVISFYFEGTGIWLFR